LRREGVPLRDQAVLCRNHAALARAGAALEAAGVPSLYLGNLFTRPEVRDMLALLQLLSGDGRGLMLVGGFPEYNVPRADTLALIAAASEPRRPFPEALALAGELAGLSPAGRDGLARLHEQLRGLNHLNNPAAMLEQYLAVRSRYLQPLLGSARFAPQRRLALYQLLQFAREQVRGTSEQRLTAAALLRRIRRLAEFGDERELRQIPERAAGMDAVRLLTVHASKGLEFAAVHLPELGKGLFPINRRGQPCPPPPGLASGGIDAQTEHAAEEECLFFVAISRARDTLILSRPEKLEKKKSNPSPFLARIAPYVRTRRVAPAVAAPPEPAAASSARAVYRAADLDLYLRCPQQYLFERVFQLDESGDESAYHRFHRVTRGVVRPVLRHKLRGREEALRALDELWQASGPHEHAYGGILFEEATKLVDQAVQRAAGGAAAPRRTYRIPLAHGTVLLRPDSCEDRADGLALQRLRTGQPSANELDKPIFALYAEAAAQETARNGRPAQVEALLLAEGEARPAIMTDRKRLNRLKMYNDAMLGIARGEFPAKPAEARFCPTCPHYFICSPEPDDFPDS
jgi:DNA helicase-2/ATP-dependent DNA helicase PcrA